MISIETDGFLESYDTDGAIDMLRYLAVSDEEIEAAMTSLIRNDHFVAEFGRFNTFLYSRKAEATDLEAA